MLAYTCSHMKCKWDGVPQRSLSSSATHRFFVSVDVLYTHFVCLSHGSGSILACFSLLLSIDQNCRSDISQANGYQFDDITMLCADQLIVNSLVKKENNIWLKFEIESNTLFSFYFAFVRCIHYSCTLYMYAHTIYQMVMSKAPTATTIITKENSKISIYTFIFLCCFFHLSHHHCVACIQFSPFH